MTEKEPTLNLILGDGKKLEVTYRNTTLYTFLGRTAIGDITFDNSSANHAFVQTGKNEKDVPQGMYFFEKFHPVYADIAKHAVDAALPSILNQRTVPECDMRAYMREVDAQEAKFHARLEGVLPEDFTE